MSLDKTPAIFGDEAGGAYLIQVVAWLMIKRETHDPADYVGGEGLLNNASGAE
jgi:hypothetical protein